MDHAFLLSGGVASPPGQPSPNSRSTATVAITLQQLIENLPEEIALLDESGNIAAVNRAWRDASIDHGYSELAVNHNYRDFCAGFAAKGYEAATRTLAALDQVVEGRRSAWHHLYEGQDRWRGRDLEIHLNRLRIGPQVFISVARKDVTEIRQLRRLQHDQETTCIASREAERQRMGRELHDSTSQILMAIELVLSRLKQNLNDEKAQSLVDDMKELLSDAQHEIDALSGADPTALGRTGLVEALRSLVDDIAQRTTLKGAVEIKGKAQAIPSEIQNALYRMSQEALSNIHRHACASSFRMLLRFRPSAIQLVIRDDGVGIPSDTLCEPGRWGVGLASMHGRLAEIGGRLSVRNLSRGTAIIATVRL